MISPFISNLAVWQKSTQTEEPEWPGSFGVSVIIFRASCALDIEDQKPPSSEVSPIRAPSNLPIACVIGVLWELVLGHLFFLSPTVKQEEVTQTEQGLLTLHCTGRLFYEHC